MSAVVFVIALRTVCARVYIGTCAVLQTIKSLSNTHKTEKLRTKCFFSQLGWSLNFTAGMKSTASASSWIWRNYGYLWTGISRGLKTFHGNKERYRLQQSRSVISDIFVLEFTIFVRPISHSFHSHFATHWLYRNVSKTYALLDSIASGVVIQTFEEDTSNSNASMTNAFPIYLQPLHKSCVCEFFFKLELKVASG